MTAPSYSAQRSSLAKQIGLGVVVESLMTDLHTSHANPIPNVPKRASRNNLPANVRRDEARRAMGDARRRSECQGTSSAVHEDGNLRVRQHFDRLAAKDNCRDAATPVRGHYDQIAPSRRGGIDDCLIDVIVLDVKRLGGDTG